MVAPAGAGGNPARASSRPSGDEAGRGRLPRVRVCGRFLGRGSGRLGAACLGLVALVFLALPAQAQRPGDLEFGVIAELRAGLGGDDGAAGRAAVGLASDAWSAFLLDEPLPSSASADEVALFDGLRCAQGDGPACGRLADGALQRGHHLAASMYLLEACWVGDTETCGRLETDGWLHYQTEQGLLGPSAEEDARWGLDPEAPPKDRVVKKIAAACDATGKKQDLGACLTLASLRGREAKDTARRAAFHAQITALCEDGSGASCELRAHLEQPDRPVEASLAESGELLWAACAQGSHAAPCFLRGRVLDIGRATGLGHWGSRAMYGYACDGGLDPSCSRLTEAYSKPARVEEITSTCTQAMARDGGDPRACTEQVTMLTFGVGLAQDEERAAQLRKEACAAGDFRPCVWAGNEAWEDDKTEAFRQYTLACAGGDGVSCGVVGRMRAKGEADLPVEPEAGFELLTKGCSLGAANACFEEGYAYSQARGVSRDSVAAATRYAASCSLGYQNACASLGVLLMDGRGVGRDVDASLWMLRAGCAEGFGSACRNLGNAYRDGLYDEERVDYARWAYRAGCDLEHEQSCTFLDELGDGETAEPPAGTRPPRSRFGTSPWRRAPAMEIPRPSSRTPRSGGARSGPGPGRPVAPRPADVPPALIAAGPIVGFGAARSLTDKKTYSLMGVGGKAHLGVFAVGARFEWLSDNRWKRANRTYQRILGRFDVGLHLPLHEMFALDIGVGGAVGSYREGQGDAQFGPGIHQGIQVMIGGPNMGESAIYAAIRWEQYQYFHPTRANKVEHAGGAWLIIGLYFGED